MAQLLFFVYSAADYLVEGPSSPRVSARGWPSLAVPSSYGKEGPHVLFYFPPLALRQLTMCLRPFSTGMVCPSPTC
jgi:hypothetical protein